MTAINPQRIEGRWLAGIALDFHTTRSTPIGPNAQGHMQFETLRPESPNSCIASSTGRTAARRKLSSRQLPTS
ncbi:MAG: hypothetical protein WA930_09965 [Rhodanobacter sp.]